MKDLIVKIGLGGFLIIVVYQLGYQTNRSDFPQLISLYAAFFITYLVICQFIHTAKDILFFVGLGVLLRLLLVFTIPNFSDDLYRFIWDGRLLIQGINPFDHLPSYYIDNATQIPGLPPTLYQQLNSPNYFTIYPPVNQAIFATATWFFPNSIWGSSLVMKSFLFVFEVGSIFLIIYLLKHFQLPPKNVLLYALNPLIIIEITGNIHFEGAMIFFLLLAIWLMAVQKKWVYAAIAFAFSVASKLLPLMFLPLLIRRIGKVNNIIHPPFGNNFNTNTTSLWRQSVRKKIFTLWTPWQQLQWQKVIVFFTIIGLILIGLFLPLINGVFISNFGDSLNLYFQKFEFNGSFYYLFRWVGFQVKGYNIIGTLGPYLAIFAFLSIIAITLLEQKVNWKTLFERMLFAICCYLFCSATVHPWYVAMPIVFCLFTRFRFPILWSGLIFLTYINYSYTEYSENLWMVGIEYVLVLGYFLFELIKRTSIKDF